MKYLGKRVLVNKKTNSQFNGYRGTVIKEWTKRICVALENTNSNRLCYLSKKQVKMIPRTAVKLRKVLYTKTTHTL